MTYFRGKYRPGSKRLKGWDYSGNGIYFITINTQGRKRLFGTIKNEKMIDSDFGKIVRKEWYGSFQIRQELILDEFVMMPDHLHAIIILTSKGLSDIINASDKPIGCAIRKPKSISSFVAGYKSKVITKIDDFIDEQKLSVLKYNRKNRLWQRNYHDHIIRDEKSFHRIKNYIINNPKNWKED